jgi:hypothetical protein
LSAAFVPLEQFAQIRVCHISCASRASGAP